MLNLKIYSKKGKCIQLYNLRLMQWMPNCSVLSCSILYKVNLELNVQKSYLLENYLEIRTLSSFHFLKMKPSWGTLSNLYGEWKCRMHICELWPQRVLFLDPKNGHRFSNVECTLMSDIITRSTFLHFVVTHPNDLIQEVSPSCPIWGGGWSDTRGFFPESATLAAGNNLI